jgi:hypothetical protein
MRIMLLLLVSTGVFSQTAKPNQNVSIEKLTWLEGTWNRTNVRPGRSTHEYWQTKGGLMEGLGVSMTGADTSFVEKLKIVSKEGELFYVADVPENNRLIYFKLTSFTETGFVCENPEHDFPKVISYQREGAKLKATVSGNGKTIDYYFEKME